MSLAERAQQFDPWWFRFELNDEHFGGDVARDTNKTDTFFAWINRLQLPVHTVLELGSHEGSHSLQLAAHPSIEFVVGLEGRPENIARAEFARSVFNEYQIEFHECNLEDFNPTEWPEFDAVFCSGLLYHLPNPWNMIPKIAQSARRCVLIDTIYSKNAPDLFNDCSGRWVREPPGPLSGFSTRSFILSFKSLFMLMMASNLLPRHVAHYRCSEGHYRVLVFCEKTNDVQWINWQTDNIQAMNVASSIVRRLFWTPLPQAVKSVLKPIVTKTFCLRK